MAHVLITGAHGFIGKPLVRRLLADGVRVSAPLRTGATASGRSADVNWIPCADIADLSRNLPMPLDAVVHLAARVHHVNETGAEAEALHRHINHDETVTLACAARDAGVERFVYVSTVKAVGERESGRPLRESDRALPVDAYGRSKRLAEESLLALATDRFAPVVLRFPLVYGPGVKANFRALWRAVEHGLPLPLGRAQAPRSLLGLANALDALTLALRHPAAAGDLFHIADVETPSVAELIRAMARAMHRPARLLPVPLAVLRAGGRLLGRSDTVERLIEPLRLDTHHATERLGWTPPYSLAAGLAAMAHGELP